MKLNFFKRPNRVKTLPHDAHIKLSPEIWAMFQNDRTIYRNNHKKDLTFSDWARKIFDRELQSRKSLQLEAIRNEFFG